MCPPELLDVRLEDGSTTQMEATTAGTSEPAPHQDNGIVGGSAASQVTAISTAYTPVASGVVTVIAEAYGVDVTVDDPLGFGLVRNPTSTTGAPGGVSIGTTPEGSSSHVGGLYTITLSFTETLPIGVPVRYGITANSTGGHNLTIFAGFTINEAPSP
jgi:hypothetical protein